MPRRNESDAVALCENVCAYYKPGKNEELACQGFVVVQRLIAGGRALSLEKKRVSERDARMDDALRARLCAACAFQAEDCDFILTGGSAAPCGGYAVLAGLLMSGELVPDDIGPAKE